MGQREYLDNPRFSSNAANWEQKACEQKASLSGFPGESGVMTSVPSSPQRPPSVADRINEVSDRALTVRAMAANILGGVWGAPLQVGGEKDSRIGMEGRLMDVAEVLANTESFLRDLGQALL